MPNFQLLNSQPEPDALRVRSYGRIEWQSSYYRCYLGGVAATVNLRYIAESDVL
jgi:hypothetical protein